MQWLIHWALSGSDSTRFARSGTRAPDLARVLNGIALALGSAEGVRDEDRPVLRMTLDRACAYGLWECGPGFDPAAVPTPLSEARFAALETRFGTLTGPDAAVWRTALDALRVWIRR